MVVDYLMATAPMGMWAVTRVSHGRQIVLEVRSPDYPVAAGLELPFEASLCEPMVPVGHRRSPPTSPRSTEYERRARALPLAIGAYVGTPIVLPDGGLFGTVCGLAATPPRTSRCCDIQPLLGLLSSLLSSVLDADTSVTAAARAVERTTLRRRRMR